MFYAVYTLPYFTEGLIFMILIDISVLDPDAFFRDMNLLSDFIIDLFSQSWNAITSDILLLLGFCIFILSIIVGIFRRVRNIK